MTNSDTNSQVDILAQALTKTYGNFDALRGVDLSIQKGEFYTLFGPNGAGKTTLIKLFSTLTKPTTGKLHILGHDALKESKTIRSHIGVISHDTYLYESLTALENLTFFADMYGLSQIEHRAESVIEQVGLKSRMHDLVRTFSRGMKQRLTVARAIVNEPRVLLLDEPYTGLDLSGAQIFGDILSDLKQHGRTILMTTHNIEEGLDLSDKVGILVNGKIVYESSSSDIEPSDFKEIYISKVNGS